MTSKTRGRRCLIAVIALAACHSAGSDQQPDAAGGGEDAGGDGGDAGIDSGSSGCERYGFPSPPVLAYPLAGRSSAISAADLDGDGKLDLVALDGFDSVKVLAGLGDGTFGQRAEYPVDSTAVAVTIADIDGDTRPDLLISELLGMQVLFGNVDGSLRAGTRVPVFDAGTTIATDINADRILDLVMLGDSLQLVLGEGDGTFGPATQPGHSAAASVAVGDLDGDGKPDLVTASSSQKSMSVLLGNGDGSFQLDRRSKIAVSIRLMALGDFNGDGKLDLVAAPQETSAISVLLGAGDGSFLPETDYPIGATVSSLAMADLNGDGRLDLVTTNVEPGTSSVLLGNGDGTFQPRVDFPAGAAPSSGTLVDVNGDHHPDLVVINNSGAVIRTLLGACLP